MMVSGQWHYLRHGNRERGLALAREAYARKPNPSHIMELGVAYLWVGDYISAGAHFQNAIESEPFSTSSFFEMAGVACWCADNPIKAIAHWQNGLSSQFADAGVALSLPLLLLVGSILRPKVFSQEEAERILKNQLRESTRARVARPLGGVCIGKNRPSGACAKLHL
jgi:tetratricopeptide (TPR) repeat protein